MTTWISTTPRNPNWMGSTCGMARYWERHFRVLFGEARMKLQQRCPSMELWGLRIAGNPMLGGFLLLSFFRHDMDVTWSGTAWCLAVLARAVSPLSAAKRGPMWDSSIQWYVWWTVSIFLDHKNYKNWQLNWNVSCEYWSMPMGMRKENKNRSF